jgi:hypothetical protein
MPIGISGVAGAGKDLFFNLLSKRVGVRRFALADQLKDDCAAWCYDQYGIDPLDCSREEKEQIRELLVFHGVFKRKLTNGRNWIDKLTPRIKSFLINAQGNDVPVVTDIRYQEYEKDEVYWVKNELNGVLVHVSQYQNKDGKRAWRAPANGEELRQDPILKNHADFLIEWEKIKCDNPLNSEYLNKKVKAFVDWYNDKIKNTE